MSEDGRSLVAQDGGWTMVDHEEVPQLMYNRSGKQDRKDGKRHKQPPEPIEMKEKTKTNQQGQIVHQTVSLFSLAHVLISSRIDRNTRSSS